MEEVTLEFKNFGKYFARKDVNTTWWTKLNVEMWRCNEFNTLTLAEKVCWIALISLVGKARKSKITVNCLWLANNAGISVSDVKSGIDKFMKLQWVYKIRTDGVRGPDEIRAADKIRLDKKEEIVETSFSPPTFLNLWNTHCGELPKALALSTKRKTATAQRIKENPDPNYWKDVIERIEASDFCNGKNDRGWKASFDFLIKSDTHIKVLEGTYDGLKTKKEKIQWECDLAVGET